MKTAEQLRHAMEQFGPAIERFLRSRLISQHTTEDIYQEVFEIYYTSDCIFENPLHLKRWLFKTASNRCKQHFRKASTQREHLFDPAMDRSSLSLHCLDDHRQPDFSEDHFIWDYVAALTPDQRECIYLYYVEGYRTAEIAEITQSNSATVRTRLRRARQALKKALKGGKYELR